MNTKVIRLGTHVRESLDAEYETLSGVDASADRLKRRSSELERTAQELLTDILLSAAGVSKPPGSTRPTT